MVKRLADFTIESEKKLIIIIQGLENAIGLQGDQSAFLSDLNYVRDLLPRDIPYPIIFCLPTYGVNSLANFAPDLWSWLSVLALPILGWKPYQTLQNLGWWVTAQIKIYGFFLKIHSVLNPPYSI